MHGMFNGMELMDSIVDKREPNFKESPKASLKLSWVDYPRRKFQVGDNVIITGNAWHFSIPKEYIGKKAKIIKYDPTMLYQAFNKHYTHSREHDILHPSVKVPYLVRVLEGEFTGENKWLPSDALTYTDEEVTPLTKANLKLSWEELEFNVGDSVKILSKSIGHPSRWSNVIGKKGQIREIVTRKFFKGFKNQGWEKEIPPETDVIYWVDTGLGISLFLAQDLELIPKYTLSWMEDEPSNPNKTSIESMKDRLTPNGIFVVD
jgi:hypothetical protein